jgi:hypothetical protein
MRRIGRGGLRRPFGGLFSRVVEVMGVDISSQQTQTRALVSLCRARLQRSMELTRPADRELLIRLARDLVTHPYT